MKFPKFNKGKKPRSKEQILADLKKNAEWVAKLKFAKEVFYPALCDASTSVVDAGFLLEGFNNQIMESFLGLMKEKKIKDLALDLKLDAKSPKFEEFKKLLALFSEMSVFEAKNHIEGMKGDLEKFKQDEFSERPLSSLKAKWIDEL